MANLGNYLQAPGFIESQNVDYLLSPSGNYFALVQDDGNFCVYPCAYPGQQPPPSTNEEWCAGSNQPSDGVFYAAMQNDGNLCVYVGTPNHQIGLATWCSGSNQPSSGEYFVELDDYGDLNIIVGTPSEPGTQIWSTK